MRHSIGVWLGGAAVVLVFGIAPARATMPVLTHQPRPATRARCLAWAQRQSADAKSTWGIQENGTSSARSAIERLSAFCLGEKVPDIVGVGSSAGYDDWYCREHPHTQLCLSRGSAQEAPATPRQSASKPWVGKWSLSGTDNCSQSVGTTENLVGFTATEVGVIEDGGDIQKTSEQDGVFTLKVVFNRGESSGDNSGPEDVHVVVSDDAKHAMIAFKGSDATSHGASMTGVLRANSRRRLEVN